MSGVLNIFLAQGPTQGPTTTPQPEWTNVEMLLGFNNGPDGVTAGFNEESDNGYLISMTGNLGQFAQYDNGQVKFGDFSGYIPTAATIASFSSNEDGDILAKMVNNDWCAETWIMFEQAPSAHIDDGQCIVSNWNAPSNQSFCIAVGTDGEIYYNYSTTGSDENKIATTGAGLASDTLTWHHIAVSFDNSATTLRIFLDGAMLVEDTGATNVYDAGLVSGADMKWGFTNDFPNRRQLRGWLDECRLTVNEPVYTAAFTPPTAAHPRG